MKQIEIKITGSGTAQEIGIQLVALAHTFLTANVDGMLDESGEFDLEDHILFTEVSELDEVEKSYR